LTQCFHAGSGNRRIGDPVVEVPHHLRLGDRRKLTHVGDPRGEVARASPYVTTYQTIEMLYHEAQLALPQGWQISRMVRQSTGSVVQTHRIPYLPLDVALPCSWF
jgi:hypothetical protein